MVALAWSQFEKRLNNNLRVFWHQSTRNIPFELAKEVLDWTGDTKLTEGIRLEGIRYICTETNKRGKEEICHRDFLCKNYSTGQKFANAVIHRLPLISNEAEMGRRLKLILGDEKSDVSFGVLHKSEEFGGGGTSLKLGQLNWQHLGHYSTVCTPKFELLNPGKQIELYWLNDFNRIISEQRKKLQLQGLDMCIDIKIGGRIIKNVIGAMGAPGANRDPKADIVFVTCEDGCLSYTGYASLKDGSKVSDFQQWGGISDISDNEEVKQFAADLLAKYPKGIAAAGGKINIGRSIKNKDIMIKAIYGKNYRTNNYNSESVEFVIQGFPSKLKGSGPYEVDFGSTHVYTDSTQHQNHLLTSKTQPVFMARADNNRNDLGIPGTRVFIYSVGGRSKWTWLDAEDQKKFGGELA